MRRTREDNSIRRGNLLDGCGASTPGASGYFGAGDEQQAAVTEILRGWLESTGPATATELAERLMLQREYVDTGLAKLESEGQILRGRFRPNQTSDETEWCNRRLLARIHRLTLGRLRREIETRFHSRFHPVPVPLATSRARLAIARGGRHAANSAPASGLRNLARLGNRRSCRVALRATRPSCLTSFACRGEVMWADYRASRF